MKNIITLILLIFPFVQSLAIDLYDFDLLKNQNNISSVDIVILNDQVEDDPIGGIVNKETFIVNDIRATIKKKIEGINWEQDSFNKTIKQINPKIKAESCLCSPRYRFALIFKMKVPIESDPFDDAINDDKKKKQKFIEKKCAVALFDSNQNSIMISDYKNKIREFIAKDSHNKNGAVIEFINLLLNKLLKEEKEKN